jgi:hypothetical protein
MVLVQAGKDLVQDFQVLLVSVSVHDQVISVDQYIWNITESFSISRLKLAEQCSSSIGEEIQCNWP